MAVQTFNMADSSREQETSVHLRGLVDTVFEEGNLDSAITLLDRLRNPVYKPYGHVLYIALFPPPAADAPTTSAPVMDTIPSSPSKFAAKNRQPFSLSPTLIEAAQNLLRVLVQTHSPASIARALPNYGLTGLDNLPDITPIAENNDDDGESELSRLSRRIKDARSCWEILKENYIRPDPINDIPKNSGRKSGRSSTVKTTHKVEDSCDVPKPVADHAFPVLESLIALFEKEETAISTKWKSFSSKSWDEIVQLVDQSQQHCLSRLCMLLNAVATRLPSLSPECLQTVFSLLPSSEVSLRFQVSLCQACLGHASDSGQRSRPRPQARNVPRAAPSRKWMTRSLQSLRHLLTPPHRRIHSQISTTTTQGYPPHFLNPLSSSDGDPPAILRKLHLKFTLISAAGELQSRMAPEERDPEWIDLLQEDSWRRP
ncbi:hypothetical protein BC629DRAFT_1442622 [Irpex lacteus]|nr:hypothetical protein BC629DRAFT_1442622 [Irpex lacteus]